MARPSKQVVVWRDAVAARYAAIGVEQQQAQRLATEAVKVLCREEGGRRPYVPIPATANRELGSK